MSVWLRNMSKMISILVYYASVIKPIWARQCTKGTPVRVLSTMPGRVPPLFRVNGVFR